MNSELVDKIILQFESIPVENLIITGGNPFLKPEIIKTLKNEIKAEKICHSF
jgi:organic radical activating enzyme